MKMRKKIIYTVAIIWLVFLASVTMFVVLKKNVVPKKIHYHAGFVVFQDDKKIDFSGTQFMYIEPCTSGQSGDPAPTPDTIQIEKAHLHDGVGDVIHVERKEGIWKDLFTNIKYNIDYSNATGYINGKLVNNFQLQPINNDDSIVVFIGNNDPSLLNQAVTKEYIDEKAKISTTCGD